MKDSSLPPIHEEDPRSTGADDSRYTLLEICGQGGFGAVWRGTDNKLGREVAVKRLNERLARDPEARRRFVHEARLTSSLEHPGIVPVYDLGRESATVPEYVMKLVRGVTLGEAIARFHDMPHAPGERSLQLLGLLNSFLAVVRTMEFAHAKGVVHRDLKPQNIILGEFGETVILDWGLAKERGSVDTGSSSMLSRPGAAPDVTQPGTVKGTPAYMAPEQASGRTEAIDERTDVYALGAILYELLTGHIPFEGQTADDIQQRVLDEEVRPLRQWDARIPRPWEAICLKSLAKSPADRFPSARALREDIERILADQPASAYRESPWERLTRWARRHRTFTLAAAGTLGAMVVVLAATLAVIAESRAREAAARRDADYQRDEAKRQADLASQRLDQVLHETYNVEMLRVRDIWRSEPAEALAALDDQRRCPPAMRDFTWGLYHRLANRQRWSATRHKGFISAIAISPDGQTIASGGADQIIRLWDSASGAERRQLTGNRGWVIDLAFAPAGETLVSAGADGTIRQWNVADGKPLREIAAHESHVNALVLMPEANRVVSGGADGHVKVWSLADGKLLSHAKSVEGEVLDLAYLPATRSIASAGDDGMIQIWDQDLQKSRPLVKHTAAVQALASIRDGRQLASASHDGMILLWDVASGSVTRSMPGHHNRVSALAATTTGGLLASASWDKTVRLWNLQADDSPVTLSGHTATALSVALAPDRSWLASGDSEGRIVNWTTDPGASQATWRDEPAVLALAFDDRQEELFCAGGDHLLVAPRGYIHRWSITQSRLDDKLLGHTLTVTALDVAPARRWLASASADRTIRLWDLDSLRELRHVGSHDGYVWSIAFAPHAPCLASGGDKVVRLWDVASGRLVRELAGPTAMVQRVAFDPSGRWLAAVDWGRTVIVWSAGDGREVWRWKNKEAGLPFVAFAGERRLITSKNETALAAWELPGGALIAEFVGHDAPLSAVCVSPDCRTVASADRSGTIQLWDAEHGQERALLAGHTSAILALQFSPDNRKLASADDSGMVKVWQSDPPSRE